MQRVQAERERAQVERDRVQAEMFAQLLERLAPAPVQAPRNLRDALGEYSDAQKIIRKLTPDELDEEAPSAGLTKLAEVLQEAMGYGVLYLQEKYGIGLPCAAAQPAEEEKTEEAKDDCPSADTDVGAAEPEHAGSNGNSQPSAEEIEAKLAAVFALLTDEEAARARALTARLPRAVLDQAIGQLMALNPEQAAAELRRHIGKLPSKAKPAVKAAS